MEAVADAYRCAGIERSEIEGVDIELTLHLGVRREQHLEAAVEAEAVDDVGADPPAHAVGGLEDHNVTACVLENASRARGRPDRHPR